MNSSKKSQAQKFQPMTWAQKFKRVCNINIETCGDGILLANDNKL